ncbi:hypothetical protein QQ045_024922 [Rhodiola kirilowii]
MEGLVEEDLVAENIMEGLVEEDRDIMEDLVEEAHKARLIIKGLVEDEALEDITECELDEEILVVWCD